MAFTRPTLAELVARSESELATRLGLGALLPRSVLSVLARVLAGVAHGLYGFLEYVARQVVPLTAEAAILERWCDLYGLERRAATKAEGPVTFSGVNGTVVPSGTIVARADGARFLATTSGTIAGGTLSLTVQAEVAGLTGNTPEAATLALVSNVPGVTAAVAGAGGIVDGLDQETDQELRDRFRTFVAARPQGGSAADYVAWTMEVAGVTRVFVLENGMGPGTVLVLFAVDTTPGGPIPSVPKVAEVQARIDDPTRRDSRPLTAAVTVEAPILQPVSVTLALTPNTAPVQQAVRDALEGLFLREGLPGTTLRLSKFAEAIGTAAGEQGHVLALPAADVVIGPTSIPALDVLTFT